MMTVLVFTEVGRIASEVFESIQGVVRGIDGSCAPGAGMERVPPSAPLPG